MTGAKQFHVIDIPVDLAGHFCKQSELSVRGFHSVRPEQSTRFLTAGLQYLEPRCCCWEQLLIVSDIKGRELPALRYTELSLLIDLRDVLHCWFDPQQVKSFRTEHQWIQICVQSSCQ
ncbi:hypothetical protein RRG08_032473 [Elysia crispata]|uniref:Uncharacterized protein n=1 Tax=Elysia crispata TaxID=231223 RepID=A0AAE1EE30_9GAST|nr:hypothetical protein RRG08_032473 [Elysia crispata]